MAGVHFLPLPQSYLEMRDEHTLQILPRRRRRHPFAPTLHKKRKDIRRRKHTWLPELKVIIFQIVAMRTTR